ncbi:MAG: hypothetical protein LBF02_01795, partial [Mycoplasmataceae bacterium]|nr:hypothetical protein [Mycoplasmataceae bacterium]
CKEEEIKKSKQTFPFLEFEFNNQKIKIKNMKIRTKTDKETYCLASGQHSQNGNNYAGYKSFPFKKLYIFENEEGKKTKIDYLNYSVLCEKSKENKKGEEFEDSLKEKFENIKNKEHICIRKGEKIRLRNEINAEVKISGIIFNKDEIYEVSGFNGNFELKSLYKDFGKRVFVSISKFLQTFEIINIDLLGTIYKDNKKETIIKKWKEKGLIK